METVTNLLNRATGGQAVEAAVEVTDGGGGTPRSPPAASGASGVLARQPRRRSRQRRQPREIYSQGFYQPWPVYPTRGFDRPVWPQQYQQAPLRRRPMVFYRNPAPPPAPQRRARSRERRSSAFAGERQRRPSSTAAPSLPVAPNRVVRVGSRPRARSASAVRPATDTAAVAFSAAPQAADRAIRGWLYAMEPMRRIYAVMLLVVWLIRLVLPDARNPFGARQRRRRTVRYAAATLICLLVVGTAAEDEIRCDDVRCVECAPDCRPMQQSHYRGEPVLKGEFYFVADAVLHQTVGYGQTCAGPDAVYCGVHATAEVGTRRGQLRFSPTVVRRVRRQAAPDVPARCTSVVCRVTGSLPAVRPIFTFSAAVDFLLYWLALVGTVRFFGYRGVLIFAALLFARLRLASGECNNYYDLGVITTATAYVTVNEGDCYVVEHDGHKVVLQAGASAFVGPLTLVEVVPMTYTLNITSRSFCPQSTVACPECPADVDCVTHTGYPDMGWGSGCAIFAKGTVCVAALVEADPTDKVFVWRRATDETAFNFTVRDGAEETSLQLRADAPVAYAGNVKFSIRCKAEPHAMPASHTFAVYEDVHEHPPSMEICLVVDESLSQTLDVPVAYAADGRLVRLDSLIRWRQCTAETCAYDAALHLYSRYVEWRAAQVCFTGRVEPQDRRGLSVLTPVRIQVPLPFACAISQFAPGVPAGRLCERLTSAALVDSTTELATSFDAELRSDTPTCYVVLHSPPGCVFDRPALTVGHTRVGYACRAAVGFELRIGSVAASVDLQAVSRWVVWSTHISHAMGAFRARLNHVYDTGLWATFRDAWRGTRNLLEPVFGSATHVITVGSTTIAGFVLLGPIGGVAGFVLGTGMTAFAQQTEAPLLGNRLVEMKFPVQPVFVPGAPPEFSVEREGVLIHCSVRDAFCVTRTGTLGVCILVRQAIMLLHHCSPAILNFGTDNCPGGLVVRNDESQGDIIGCVFTCEDCKAGCEHYAHCAPPQLVTSAPPVCRPQAPLAGPPRLAARGRCLDHWPSCWWRCTHCWEACPFIAPLDAIFCGLF